MAFPRPPAGPVTIACHDRWEHTANDLRFTFYTQSLHISAGLTGIICFSLPRFIEFETVHNHVFSCQSCQSEPSALTRPLCSACPCKRQLFRSPEGVAAPLLSSAKSFYHISSCRSSRLLNVNFARDYQFA